MLYNLQNTSNVIRLNNTYLRYNNFFDNFILPSTVGITKFRVVAHIRNCIETSLTVAYTIVRSTRLIFNL